MQYSRAVTAILALIAIGLRFYRITKLIDSFDCSLIRDQYFDDYDPKYGPCHPNGKRYLLDDTGKEWGQHKLCGTSTSKIITVASCFLKILTSGHIHTVFKEIAMAFLTMAAWSMGLPNGLVRLVSFISSILSFDHWNLPLPIAFALSVLGGFFTEFLLHLLGFVIEHGQAIGIELKNRALKRIATKRSLYRTKNGRFSKTNAK